MSGILENSPTVQRWFIQLRKRSANVENGGIPPSTRKMALEALSKFTEYAKMKPDELIALAHKETRETGSIDKINDLLDGFWMNYPTKTSASVYFAMVKSFFRGNGIALTTRQPAFPFSKRKEIHLTSDIIRRICDVASLRHAAWMLANSYMGLRIGAFRLLKIEDFHTENWEQQKPLYPVSIGKHISGTFDYTAFIGHDAKAKLASYFDDKTFSENRPWKATEGTTYYIQTFKKYAYRADVIDAPSGLTALGVPKGLCPIRTHAFRKRLQTVLEGSHMPLNWVDRLLGHIPRGSDAKAYSQPTEDDLYKAYLIALPALEIYGHYTQMPLMQRQRIMDALKFTGMTEEQLVQIQNVMGKVCPCFTECPAFT